MFRKAVYFAGLMLFPSLVCLNVWQSLRYQQLEDELVRMQKQQVDLLEKNKRALAAVAVYSSPSRVGALAEEELDLEKLDPEDVLLLRKVKP